MPYNFSEVKFQFTTCCPNALKNLQQVFMLMANIFKGDPIILMHGISPFECPETTKPPLDLPFPHI
jgi:hypothetical protein